MGFNALREQRFHSFPSAFVSPLRPLGQGLDVGAETRRVPVNKLRVVGSSADLESLVLASRKTKGRRGSHVLPIDDRLFRVLEDVVRKRRAKEKGSQPVKRPPSEPKLAPREVQRLLRAGRPVDQVAKAAGMDPAWVERFLGPVLDERDVAIQDFRRARLEKPRLGVSGVPLGEAVARNLRARRVRMSDEEVNAAWGASRLETQPWVISLTFSNRGREQRATWRYDPRTGEVTAANRLGADLGWVADGRRAPSG
ncbi:MAG: septation protein SepH, partial [bacterium]